MHQRWFEGGEPQPRNWDLHLSYYGDDDNAFSDRPADVTMTRDKVGSKIGGIAKCMSKLGNRIDEYDFVWLPDDDLECDRETLNSFFDIVAQNRFALSQPALGPNSFPAHDITRQRKHLRWRYTNFVEIMCPCFSRDAWNVCKSHFGSTTPPWGLDLVFPKLLGYPCQSIAIVDETPVVHTRAPMSGDHPYGADVVNQTLNLLQDYGFPELDRWPYNVLLTTYAGIDKAGKLITDPAELYRGAAPKPEFQYSSAAGLLTVTKEELSKKNAELTRELEDLEARWRRQLEEEQERYKFLDREWRQRAETAHIQHIALDASWRKRVEENIREWSHQKEDYEKMLEAYRQNEQRSRELLEDNTEDWMRQKAAYEKMLEAYRQNEQASRKLLEDNTEDWMHQKADYEKMLAAYRQNEQGSRKLLEDNTEDWMRQKADYDKMLEGYRQNDEKWQKLLEDNTKEWLRQKEQYEKMLEAYRENEEKWRKLLEDNTEEWTRQKAEYDKMLEAYRAEERKGQASISARPSTIGSG